MKLYTYDGRVEREDGKDVFKFNWRLEGEVVYDGQELMIQGDTHHQKIKNQIIKTLTTEVEEDIREN